MVTVAGVNLPHSSYCRAMPHSDRGKAPQWWELLEQWSTRPAVVWGAWRTSHQGYDHRALEAWRRRQGSGEALIVLEARARSGRGLRPRPRARASPLFLLPFFVLLIWVSRFMVPNRCNIHSRRFISTISLITLCNLYIALSFLYWNRNIAKIFYRLCYLVAVLSGLVSSVKIETTPN
jgi:hypothetical protein